MESKENKEIRESLKRYLKTGGRAKLPYSRLIFWKCDSCGATGSVETNEVSLCGLVRAARSVMVCCGDPDVGRVESLREKMERERCARMSI